MGEFEGLRDAGERTRVIALRRMWGCTKRRLPKGWGEGASRRGENRKTWKKFNGSYGKPMDKAKGRVGCRQKFDQAGRVLKTEKGRTKGLPVRLVGGITIDRWNNKEKRKGPGEKDLKTRNRWWKGSIMAVKNHQGGCAGRTGFLPRKGTRITFMAILKRMQDGQSYQKGYAISKTYFDVQNRRINDNTACGQ